MSDTKRILVKRIKSALPTNLFATLLSLRDVSGTPTSVNSFIQWDSDLQKFTFSASTISDAVLSNLVDSAVAETVDSDYINSILGTSVNAATLNNQPGSYYLDYNNLTNVPAAGTDSSTVSSIIIEDVDKTFIDALNVDANTLGGNDSSYYLNYNNFTNTPGTDSSTVRTIADEQIALADIQDLANVDITGITNNQVLKWDSANSRFIAANDATSGGGEGGIDSDVVIALVDSDYIQARVTLDGVGIDSATASTIADTRITSTVNKSFVDNLGVDAATLGGRDSSYFTNASNISSGTLDSSHIPTLALGTDTTGNYVSDVSGTANEIEVSSSTGSVTIGLPSNVTIDSNLTVGGYIGGPAVFTIDPAAIGDSTGKVVILGDLQVDGVQTTINSTTVSISDKNIVLADSATDSSQANGAGITVNGANAKITYTSVDDKWVFNKVPYYNTNRLLTTADDLHDSDAVQGQIDASLSVLDTHDSAAVVGQINATVDATFVRPLARAALVAGSNITYDSSTGVIASTASGGIDSAAASTIADTRIGVASIGDLSDVDLTNIQHNYVIKWDSNNDKFIGAVDVTSGGGGTDADTLDGQDGTYYLNYNNFTNTPNILDSNHVAALIDSADTHDSAAVQGQIDATFAANSTTDLSEGNNLYYTTARVDSAIDVRVDSDFIRPFIDQAFIDTFDTHDSAAVVGQINNEVTISYINSLTGVLDADTLGGNDSSYYTNASNISSGTLDSSHIPSLILGADITGNYVVDVSGTTNQIEVTHTPSAGSTPVIGLPSNVTIDSNLTVGGYIGGPAVFTIDPAAIGDSTGKVVILGDLQVDGLTTTINSTTVSISDKNIILADSAADSSQANGAGITVNGANATIQYASTGDKWVFNKAPYYNTNRLLTAADDLHDSNLVQGQINSSFTNDTTFVRVAGDEVTGDINFGDNVKATFGDDSDFIIIHNGSHTVLKDQGTGSLYIEGSQIHLSSQNFGNPIFLTTGDNDGVKIFDSSGDLRLHSRDTGIYTYTGLFVDNNAVLTTASTIDADTLDTLQATSFLRSDQSDSMAGSLTIDDDLFVGGRIVSTNDSNISFGDNIILINTATTGNNTLDAGIEIERGLSTNVSFIWDESQDYWSFGTQNVHTTGVMYFANEFQDSTDLPDASIYHGMFAHDHNGDRAVYAHGTWHTLLDATYSTTDQLTEGATNKYYTFNKVDSDVGTIVNAAYVNALNVNADTVDSLHASQFLRSDSDDTMSANLTVTGTITTGSGNNTTVIKADTGTYDNYSIEHDLDGTLVTLSTATVIDTYTHNSAKTSIEYLIHLEHNTLAETQITKILATYKGSGTDVQFTEFGEIFTGDSSLGALTIDENSGSIRLLLDPREDEDVISKVVRTIIV